MRKWARQLLGHRTSGAEPGQPQGEFERVKASWEALGAHDPLWAIVSVPDKRGNRWELEQFFSDGARELQHVMNALAKAQVTVPPGRALDFGAGVGRLTQALAAHFQEVDGVDISTPMIEQARTYNRHGDRVRYHLGATERLPFNDGTFDFVFSKIVLQHMGVELQRGYVREFIRVLKPGGLVVFQAVARALVAEGTHFESPVETPGGTVTIDMNIFPRDDVERTLTGAGGKLLHRLDDVSAGDAFESVLYVGTR